MPTASGLFEAHLTVSDLNRSVAFYRDVVGLPLALQLEGVPQVQAAAQLGLSVSGMKARVQRGRHQLGELLLDCCHVELDSQRRVTAYRSRSGSCSTCDCR